MKCNIIKLLKQHTGIQFCDAEVGKEFFFKGHKGTK